jgi:hypothetical protein
MKLADAIKELTSTYSSLDSVALGLPVDAKEVNDALSKAKPDTAEFVALSVLAKYNPYNQEIKIKEIPNDNQDKFE